MKKIYKRIILTIFLILIVTTGAIMLINTLIKNKVENFLENRLPATVTQNYKKLHVNLLDGTLTFDAIDLSIKNKKDSNVHTTVSLPTLVIENVSYWAYLFKDKIHIEDIKIKSANISYSKHLRKKDTSSNSNKPFVKLHKKVVIDELSIDNTTLTILDGTNDSIMLFTPNLTVEIDDIVVSKETLKKRLPIEFKRYEASTDSVYVKVSPYENLYVGDFFLKHNDLSVKDLKLKTKYSRGKHAQILNKERDHFNLTVSELNVKDIDFGFNKRKLFVKADSLLVQNPYLNIYRNKLVADDPSIKPLYSKMLRTLPFDLSFDIARIKNGEVIYSEKVNEGTQGGTINFSKLYTTISHLGNTYNAPTTLDIEADFMNNTPVKVVWQFDVNNPNDRFSFKGELGTIGFSELNKFVKPNLNVLLEGTANKTYFNINGNSHQSNFDFRINHDNLKVDLLKKQGAKKKKFLSAIANLFVSNDSDGNKGDFCESSGSVSRNKTKSFFNYIWLNIFEGLKKCLT